MMSYDSDNEPPPLTDSSSSETDSDDEDAVRWQATDRRFYALPDRPPPILTSSLAILPAGRRPHAAAQTPAQASFAYNRPVIDYRQLSSEHEESSSDAAPLGSEPPPPPPPPTPPAPPPPETPFGTPNHRPTHKHAGVRIGEASNPGPPKYAESEGKTAATPHNRPRTPTSSRQGTRTSVPTPPTRLRKTTEDQTAARTSLEYNLGMIGCVLLPTAPDNSKISTCPVQHCSFTTAFEDGQEAPNENKS